MKSYYSLNLYLFSDTSPRVYFFCTKKQCLTKIYQESASRAVLVTDVVFLYSQQLNITSIVNPS